MKLSSFSSIKIYVSILGFFVFPYNESFADKDPLLKEKIVASNEKEAIEPEDLAKNLLEDNAKEKKLDEQIVEELPSKTNNTDHERPKSTDLETFKEEIKKRLTEIEKSMQSEARNALCSTGEAAHPILGCSQTGPNSYTSTAELVGGKEFIEDQLRSIMDVCGRLAGDEWRQEGELIYPAGTSEEDKKSRKVREIGKMASHIKASSEVGGQLNCLELIKEAVNQAVKNGKINTKNQIEESEIVKMIEEARNKAFGSSFRVFSYDAACLKFEDNNKAKIQDLKQSNERMKKATETQTIYNELMEHIKANIDGFLKESSTVSFTSPNDLTKPSSLDEALKYVLNPSADLKIIPKAQNPAWNQMINGRRVLQQVQTITTNDIAKVIFACIEKGSDEPIQALEKEEKWKAPFTGGKFENRTLTQILQKIWDEQKSEMFEIVADKKLEPTIKKLSEEDILRELLKANKKNRVNIFSKIAKEYGITNAESDKVAKLKKECEEKKTSLSNEFNEAIKDIASPDDFRAVNKNQRTFADIVKIEESAKKQES